MVDIRSASIELHRSSREGSSKSTLLTPFRTLRFFPAIAWKLSKVTEKGNIAFGSTTSTGSASYGVTATLSTLRSPIIIRRRV